MSNPNPLPPPVQNVRRAGNVKPWTRALQKHFDQNPDALHRIAVKVTDMALAGDLEAIKEIGNRLEGKAIQQTEVSVSGNATFAMLTREQIMEAIRQRLANPDVAAAVGLAKLEPPK